MHLFSLGLIFSQIKQCTLMGYLTSVQTICNGTAVAALDKPNNYGIIFLAMPDHFAICSPHR